MDEIANIGLVSALQPTAPAPIQAPAPTLEAAPLDEAAAVASVPADLSVASPVASEPRFEHATPVVADVAPSIAVLEPATVPSPSPELEVVAIEEAADASVQPTATLETPSEPLVSPEAGATIETSFHALATSVFLQNTSMVESLTRDMLRPMLKSWLDDNLPAIVERLVRIEIERVARGGRA